jgi:hypothetical protein
MYLIGGMALVLVMRWEVVCGLPTDHAVIVSNILSSTTGRISSLDR